MYTVQNFKTKKALKDAVASGAEVRLYAPGFGQPKDNGTEPVEGPHYPEPHRWYAQVEMRDRQADFGTAFTANTARSSRWSSTQKKTHAQRVLRWETTGKSVPSIQVSSAGRATVKR